MSPLYNMSAIVRFDFMLQAQIFETLCTNQGS